MIAANVADTNLRDPKWVSVYKIVTRVSNPGCWNDAEETVILLA